MAKGAEGRTEQKKKKKQARTEQAQGLLDDELYNEFSQIDPNEVIGDIGFGPSANKSPGKSAKPHKKSSNIRNDTTDEMESIKPASSSRGIKTAPLVLLILMMGTTIIPALLYAGDWFGAFIQKNHVLGSIGHKLGIGPSPRKRVLSFYEKHDPNKLDEVPTILAKFYGDYPKLVKKLERKYGDYGYFINWEEDEAPMKLAMEKLYDTRTKAEELFQKYAPHIIKTGVRNMKYNFGFLYKKGRKVWRKNIWPVLEPFIGVPDGAAAQKRKDAQKKRAQTPGRKNHQYRDDDEM